MTNLHDSHGRSFYYLRLSITEVCNFKCGYCLPDGYQKNRNTFLDVMEIKRLVTAFSELGIQKIRLTGGEPTVRKDFLDIAKTIASLSGIKTLALTTNGYRLLENIENYKAGGINHITVSIDSLNPEKFQFITGHNSLADILAGIKKANALGFKRVKINTVLLNHLNTDEIDAFIELTRDYPISVRFIELMQTGTNLPYFQKHHIDSGIVRNKLEQHQWQMNSRAHDAGPALEYSHPDYQGTMGIIAPYGKDFCATCNRLRVSATGDLHLCLFGNLGYPLRQFLQSDDQIPALKQLILNKLPYKHKSHYLHEGDTGINSHFASIGG